MKYIKNIDKDYGYKHWYIELRIDNYDYDVLYSKRPEIVLELNAYNREPENDWKKEGIERVEIVDDSLYIYQTTDISKLAEIENILHATMKSQLLQENELYEKKIRQSQAYIDQNKELIGLYRKHKIDNL